MMKKLLAPGTIVFFFFLFLYIIPFPSSKAIDVRDTLMQQLQYNRNRESQILRDILHLDAKIQSNLSKSKELAERITTVQKELRELQVKQNQLEDKLQAGQSDFNRSLQFFYTYNASPFIASALLSSDWSEYFIRRELLKHLVDYFLTSVRQTLALQAEVQEKNRRIAVKEKELKLSQYETLSIQRQLSALKTEQEKKLAKLRKENTALSRDLLALEKAWSDALPTLQYLLNHLPELPWKKLKPDSVELNFSRGLVQATFTQENLNRTLMESKEKLKGIRLVVDRSGLTIPGPNFEVKGTLKVAGPHQLFFIPDRLVFAGLPLERSTWLVLLEDEKIKLDLPPPDYGLKFKDIYLEKGLMVLNLVL